MKFRRFAFCLSAPAAALLFFFAADGLWAQAGGPGRGDYLTLKVAVMGPGDELYFWWGHIALVIDDASTGESRFFDYGIFSFESDHFFSNFVLGRLRYSCGVSPAERSYRAYRNTNRDITVYTLNLPPRTRDEIRRFAENNVLPENKYYWYHHFRDNCSTRIRDIIDLAAGGQFKAAFENAAGRYTLRQHVRRHTWFSPFFDWLLNFLMGQDIDRPITVWDEMFLPREVGNNILNFTYTDTDGAERKLVTKVEELNRAVKRPAVLDVPRRQWPRELALGTALSALIVFLALLKREKPAVSRVSLGLLQSFLGLLFGAAGTALFFMTFFTNHDYTYHNINVIYINPLLLAALPLGILYARGSSAAGSALGRFSPQRLLRVLWTCVFLGGVLSLLLRLLPGIFQQNQVTLALVLPFAFTLSVFPPLIKSRLVKNNT
jgi:hypothetical protein